MFAYVDASTLARTIARVRTIDASWTPDADADSDRARFYEERIPGSVFYDHDGACDLSSPLPQAFPPRDAFAATLGGTLGVKATDDVVVYARDGDARAAAEFCAVVLLEHGHVGSVSVLRGGLEAWINAGGETERGRETSREYASVEYGGARRDGAKSSYVDARDLLKNLSTQRLQVLDCRSVNVFAGAARDSAHVRIQGRSIHFDGFRVGHIPGAKNVPYASVVNVEDEKLKRLFEEAGLDLTMPVAVVGTGGVDAAPAVAAALSRVGCTASVLKNGMCAWCTAQGSSYPMSISSSSPHASHMDKRLIIWTVTRARGTALERSFTMHSESMVMHELLTEPYLKENNPTNFSKILSGQSEQSIESSGCSYATMLEVLTADYSAQGRPLFVSKELSCYFDLQQIKSTWLKRFAHVVLIRPPKDTLESFYRVSIESKEESTYFDPSEAGFSEAFGIVNALKRINAKVMVLDGDIDLLQRPEQALREICDLASVNFESSMLSWKPDELSTWIKFRGWHDDAAKSTGFKAVEKAPMENVPEEVYVEAARYQPYYDAVSWERKEISQQWPILRQITSGSQHRFSVVVCASDEGASGMFPRLAAARLSGVSIYEFKPTEIAAASKKCPFIFDQPIVLLGARGPTLHMAEALRSRLNEGTLSVARIVLIDDKDHHARLEGFKYSSVSEESLNDQASMDEVLSSVLDDLKTARSDSVDEMNEVNALSATTTPTVHWRSGLASALQDVRSDKPCVTDASGTYTMKEVYSRAYHVANALEKFGAVNSRVGLFLRASASSVWCAMGSLLCESVFCEIPGWYRDSDLERVLRINGSKAIIASRDLVPFVPDEFKHLVLIAEDLESDEDVSGNIHPALTRPDTPQAPGFSVLTSGTTGVSKILVCPQSALTDSQTVIAPHMRGDDVMGSFWVYYYFFIPLLAGRTLCIIPNDFFLKPRDLVSYVQKMKMTMLYLSPSILESCLLHCTPQEFSEGMQEVHTILLTGERVRRETRILFAERLTRTRLIDVYSTNETGDLAISDYGGAFFLREGTQARVLSEDGESVVRGTVGQLHIRKSGLLVGYYGDDGYVSIEGDWYPTGDLVRWLGRNRLTFESRQKSAYVKIRGFKVSPLMVQDLLCKSDLVQQAIVSTLGTSDIDQQLIAAISFKDGARMKESELRAHMAANVPHYMIPSAFYDLGSGVSTASSGKVMKIDVDKLNKITDDSEIELNAKETEVAEVWREVLEQPGKNFAPTESFFDYGGSLKFVELAAALSKKWSLNLTVPEVIAKPTLEEMANISEDYRNNSFDPDVEVAKYDFSNFTRAPKKKKTDATPKNVLLTGATGFLGAYLLHELASNPGIDKIYAVVRAKDNFAAQSRVQGVFEKRGLTFSDDIARKTVFVRGDMSKPGYDIPETVLGPMLDGVDVVISGGAEVNMVKSYSALEKVNVGGTYNGLELASRAGARHVLISTQYPLPGEVSTGYRRSKEVGELLCARAQKEVGVESAVLLFGDIGISRAVGSLAPDDDYIVIFLRACLATGFFPRTEWAVSILCVDDCVKMLADISRAGAVDRYAFDGVAREVKGKLMPFSRLHDWLSKEIPLQLCSYEGWLNAVKSGAAEGNEILQRVLLTIDSMEVELKAEGEHFSANAESDALYSVDDAWGANLIGALVLELYSELQNDDKDMTIGYAALAMGEDLVPYRYRLPNMTPTSVEIKVEYCGLCGSDDHLIVGDYGEYAVWPQVCGHEIVGTVTQVGDAVTSLKSGQRVGVGWQSRSCHDCEWCARGDEQLCSAVECTCCEGNKGGFADRMRVNDSQFVYKIPDELSSAEVAPLLCGGQTVWTPLNEQTKSTDRVGILGLGGLGHMAIKFARALGRDVTAISSSASKRDAALSHGANKFLVHTDDDEMAAAAGTLDFILVTIATNKEVDFAKFFPLLRPRGTICFVGMCPPISADVFTLGFTMNNITTSNTGGKKDMIQMLDFCAKHSIGASVAVTPLSEINTAVAALRSGDSHFRHVLSNDVSRHRRRVSAFTSAFPSR